MTGREWSTGPTRTPGRARMYGRKRMAWRLTGLATATLLLMAGCTAGTPGPGEGGGSATTAAPSRPAPAPVTLPPAPSGRPAVGLLGVVGFEPSTLARLDPATLRALPGRRVELEVDVAGWSVSPDRSLAVVGDANTGGLVEVVDLGAMRSLGTITIQPGTSPAASAWLGPRRVAVAVGDPGGSCQVAILDPVAGRLLACRKLAGDLGAVGRFPGGLVLLLTPAGAIGPARLAVVQGPGVVRTVLLGRISAGFKPPKSEGPEAIARQRAPGLAVDPVGRRAFVVAAGAPLAEVDLRDLRVAYHSLERPASLLARLGRWLLPPAEAKVQAGSWRQARWVGNGLLAVSGGEQRVERDKNGDLQQEQLPSGVDLVDTRRWQAHDLHAHATATRYEAGRLLLYGGGAWRSDQQIPTGVGLTVYGPGDRRPVHLLGRRSVDDARVRGDLAYVTLGEAQGGFSWAVIDLRSGRTLHRATTDPPILLLGDASDW
jgi:hypothetical protein